MNKFLKQILILISLIFVLVLPYFAFAADTPLDRLQDVGPRGGYAAASETRISGIIGIAIKAFLGVLGVIFIILIILAGYDWMIASGREEKVTKAKDTIRRAIIGLAIIIGSYAIWNFIFDNLINK